MVLHVSWEDGRVAGVWVRLDPGEEVATDHQIGESVRELAAAGHPAAVAAVVAVPMVWLDLTYPRRAYVRVYLDR